MLNLLKRYTAYGLLACASVLSACDSNQPITFSGTNITGSHLGKKLSMVDSRDQSPVTLDNLKSKVSIVFFGYTQCPDICPTSLSQLAAALEILGDDADQVNVLLISVDPERDTPEILTNYVAAFDDRIIGLTGTPEQLQQTADSFKAIYLKSPGANPDQYTMDHSASLYILDKNAESRALLPNDATPDEIAHDVRALL